MEEEVVSIPHQPEAGYVTLTAQLSLSEGAKLNTDAPSSWTLAVDRAGWAYHYPAKGMVESGDLSIPVQHPAMTTGQVVSVELSARVYICTVEGL